MDCFPKQRKDAPWTVHKNGQRILDLGKIEVPCQDFRTGEGSF